MGAEARCVAEIAGARHPGRAQLEAHELVFRATAKSGPRVKVALAGARVEARDGWLLVDGEGAALRLELGAAAPRWLDKIRNPPGRLDKLGIKQPGLTVVLLGDIGGELERFAAELEARGARVTRRASSGADVVFVAAETRAALARLPALRQAIQPAGAIWIVRPKGSPAISEAEVMAAGKAAGLVDVKVVAFSATHTAEKLVIPVAKRGGAR